MVKYIEIRWDEYGIEQREKIEKETLGRFILIYSVYSKAGREADRASGIAPYGYELEDWFINKRLED